MEKNQSGPTGFIGSHLCEEIMLKTSDKLLTLNVYNDKIKHLPEADALLRLRHIHSTPSTSGTIAASKAPIKCQICCI
ncbi:hypothetical protein CRG98_038843 [Punica granatum]|uniref:NAD-dependent epimerase/dehydratase domain-containing protein n=1 Tax=Punica granatum TaxID=22663 RepID=A0A2I0IA25_PUNGR|nr:hypothetical protein CRG98_038843 [Punica granatum]